MQEDLNKEWMDNYEVSYSKYKIEWDEHYAKVRLFILSSLPRIVSNWGFIGVTSTVPEISLEMLNSVEKLTFLDIYKEGMYRARKFLGKQYNFSGIDIRKFDSTHGFVEHVLSEFSQYDDGVIEREYLLKTLNRMRIPEVNYKEAQYDFITHLGLMDCYLMPVYTLYCNKFKEQYEEFFTIMKKLNDQALAVSLSLLHQMLSYDGKLVISTPVSRIPEGNDCEVSLFWKRPFELHLDDAGFDIVGKTEHIWKEIPEKNGHSHNILNVLCVKKENE